jgi:multiple sugar transport system substrate-binding protein
MRNRFATLLALLVIASMLLSACGAPVAPAGQPAAAPAATTAPAAEPAAASAPVVSGDRVQIRWFIGLGTGSGESQIAAQEAVIASFNESQDRIELVAEFVPNTSARDTLATQIASGAGPDIIGPVGWGGSNAFAGQYLDLSPFIDLVGYDLSQFNEALVSMYQGEEGAQVGLPFAVFPAAVFYQTEMFDEAGLNYPPQNYGEGYMMPDGTEVAWNWDTLTEVARILTVDANGNDASMSEFDKSQIVQYGFVFQWQTHPNYIGSYLGGAGSLVAEDGSTAQVPAGWVEGWKWWHEGMWGDRPFIPSGPVTQSPEFGSGNAFSSGKVAIAVVPSWYTCCIADAGQSWDLAAMPTDANGVVNSRIDADTFRILKDTKHPEEAFEVLDYLIGDASLSLLAVYGGMPARTADFDQWLSDKQEQFPWVTNWGAISNGLSYPDVPSAEAFVPNWNQVWDRVNTLDSLMVNEADLDMDAEAAKIESDVQSILNAAGQ